MDRAGSGLWRSELVVCAGRNCRPGAQPADHMGRLGTFLRRPTICFSGDLGEPRDTLHARVLSSFDCASVGTMGWKWTLIRREVTGTRVKRFLCNPILRFLRLHGVEVLVRCFSSSACSRSALAAWVLPSCS